MRADDRLRVEVLGPLRARTADGRDVTPTGVLPRRLLALLVLHRGRAVSADAAVEVLWPSSLPEDPAAALQNHAYRLRRRLPAGVISSVGDGYRLERDAVDVDADRLSTAVAAVAADDRGGGGGAMAEIDATLARWEGPAYPELDDVDDGRIEAQRLDELRTRAREVRAAAHIATGRTDGLAAELVALVDAHPLRERPRSLLMDALAATGRHAEALRVYDDFRRLLGEELGIEPSPALNARQAELLAGTAPAVWTPASRLPVPASTLIGRDELATEATGLLDGHRLVTLVGPGGVGKTRLSVEIGRRLLVTRPARPVVLCELAAADAAGAVDVVAGALGIDARPGVPLAERVVRVLGDTALVVVLDNCEHVLDEAAELAERLVTRCAGVAVVATSRERLRVPGERVVAVPTLTVAGDAPPAVRLFVERARAVAPGFDPDDEELARIAEIVRRLDGLPLAVELAAARLLTHELDEVATGLDRRFALLSSGYRTSARHGSLAAAVSWSYELLDGGLQRSFSDLSVFAGPFDAAAAAAVCDLDAAEASATLAQLVERSLVLRAPARRYVLLETLRAFGAEQLAATGRAAVVGARHARHQLHWIEDANRRLADADGPVLAEIDAAIGELRSALGWFLGNGDVELAGQLVSELWAYGFLRLRPDVLSWSARVIDADPDDRSPWAPQVWVAAAYAAWMAGDVAETGVRSERALRSAERAGGEVPAVVAASLGSFHLYEGRLGEAASWYRRAVEAASVQAPALRQMLLGNEALALGYARDPTVPALVEKVLAEASEPSAPAAYVWYCAGEARLAMGELDAARDLLERAMELAERTRATFVTGLAGASKASIDARVGDPAVAAAEYRQLISHWRRAGMWSTQWTVLRSIAGLLERLGRHRDAAVLAGAVRATAAGHRIFGADAAALDELGTRLRAVLGRADYDAALVEGAALDGEAAVDHALGALPPS